MHPSARLTRRAWGGGGAARRAGSPPASATGWGRGPCQFLVETHLEQPDRDAVWPRARRAGAFPCRVAARILLPALARPVAHKDSENGKLPKTILIFPGYGTEDLRGPRHLPQIRETRRKRMVGVPSRRAFLVAAVALLVCLAAADAAKPSKKGKSSVAAVQGGLQAGVQLVKNALAMVWKAVAAILGAVNPCLPNGIFDCGKSVQKFAGLSLLASSVPERLVAHILLAPVPRICVCSNTRSMQTPSSKA